MKSSTQPSSKHIYYLNGKYIPASEAKVSIADLGFVRGFALFESIRTYSLVPFLLKPHLDRLFQGMKRIGLKSPLSQNAISKIIDQLLKKNRFEEALIRIYLTGGLTSSILPSGKPTIIILTDPLHPFAPWQYEKGISLMTTPSARIYPEVKSTVYFAAVFKSMEADRRGFTEVAYVDSEGSLLEGTTFNVVAVLPGPRLVIPRENVLAGVTVGCVMDLAKKLKIPIERKPISKSILRRSKELFITSSNREIIPVNRVDQLRIGDGKPGRVTRMLHAHYCELTCSTTSSSA